MKTTRRYFYLDFAAVCKGDDLLCDALGDDLSRDGLGTEDTLADAVADNLGDDVSGDVCFTKIADD